MHECRFAGAGYEAVDLEGVFQMREEELRRIFRRVAITTGLMSVMALPISLTAQTPGTDPMTQPGMVDDDDLDDDDDMEWGWLGLLGLAGLLGLRRRDDVDRFTTPTRQP
jgi:MYXO-CTERM domain-containing protein